MKQFYIHYEQWEDYKNGMYAFEIPDLERCIELSTSILGDPDICKIAMDAVLNTWPVACKVNLTNLAINRIAWLGWSACSVYANSPKLATCLAWKQLTRKQQREANKIADCLIKSWEREYYLSNQLKLEFNV